MPISFYKPSCPPHRHPSLIPPKCFPTSTFSSPRNPGNTTQHTFGVKGDRELQLGFPLRYLLLHKGLCGNRAGEEAVLQPQLSCSSAVRARASYSTSLDRGWFQRLGEEGSLWILDRFRGCLAAGSHVHDCYPSQKVLATLPEKEVGTRLRLRRGGGRRSARLGVCGRAKVRRRRPALGGSPASRSPSHGGEGPQPTPRAIPHFSPDSGTARRL